MAAEPASYLPVEGRPWRLTMGLRPLDPARWLEVDNLRLQELAEKRRLLEQVHDRVVATLPGSEAAGADLLEAVIAYMHRYHPETLVDHGDGLVEETSSGEIIATSALHPVDAAGRMVQEDLCVMEHRDGTWVLTAASLCFPSRWSLAAKLGRDLSSIHAPVHGYAESLSRPTDAFFDRLSIERPMWRLNWTLIDSPDLHQPHPDDRHRAPAVSALTNPSTDVWFRVERQTLRRLTERPAIIFTIRTYVTRLGELVFAHPEVCDSLRATLPTVPPETVAYKGWHGMVGSVMDWLESGHPA